MSTSFANDVAQPPPAPPPPPPPRYATRAANALARFAQPFFQGSRPPSPDGDPYRRTGSAGFRLPAPQSAASPSSSVVHRTGIPIVALDISPDRTHAVLAGREILKTIRVAPDSCNEAFNLRSAITSYNSTHSSSDVAGNVKRRHQLTANDVKWSHSNFSSIIATAAPNGQIILHDLEKACVQIACLHEHTRQVHRLAFNPHHAPLLLSASHGGTIRLWDLRTGHRNGAVGTFASKATFASSSESMRDVRWSPTMGVGFVACTDSGVIQEWDILQPGKPILRVKAHAKACRAVDWHPDGKHVVSGGADKMINVWDFSIRNSRMKPYMQLRAPQPVMNVRWRPPCFKEAHHAESWQATHLAASYDVQDPKIQVWDFRRPCIPFREISHYDTPSTDFLWHSEDLLWSVGYAGMFTQTDLKQARDIIRNTSLSGVAVAPSGDICLFSEGRPRRDPSFVDSYEFLQGVPPKGDKTGQSSESPSTNEGSFEDQATSLSVRLRQRKALKSSSHRTTGSSSYLNSVAQPLSRFNVLVPKNMPIRVAQVIAHGGIYDVARPDLFAYFARNYELVDGTAGPFNTVISIVADTFERNADLATVVGEHQLGQAWRTMAWAARKDLERKARQNRIWAPSTQGHVKSVKESYPHQKHLNSHEGDFDQARLSTLKAVAPPTTEDGSNTATPVARPVSDLTMQLKQNRMRGHDDEISKLSLPGPTSNWSSTGPHPQPGNPELSPRYAQESSFVSKVSSSESHSSDSDLATGVMDLEDGLARRRAAALAQNALRLDPQSNAYSHNPVAPSFIRHDSGERFEMFSESTESSFHGRSSGTSLKSNYLASSPLEHVQSTATRSEMLQDGDHVAKTTLSQKTEKQSSPIHAASPLMAENDQSAMLRPFAHQAPIIHPQDVESQMPLDQELESIHQGDSEPSLKSPHPEPSVEELPPWSATALLRPLIEYHTSQLFDCQLPAHVVISLAPLLAHDMSSTYLESILLSYHDQLISHSLFVEAAHLRKVVNNTYPEVSGHGTFGVQTGGAWCTYCRKPSKGEKSGFCERCQSLLVECVICEDDVTFFASSGSDSHDGDRTLWAWCQECGHSQHSTCLRKWWSNPEMSHGFCPVLGCLHACVPGKARDNVLKAEAEDRRAAAAAAAAQTSSIRGDAWTIAESRAVQQARRLVGVAGLRASVT